MMINILLGELSHKFLIMGLIINLPKKKRRRIRNRSKILKINKSSKKLAIGAYNKKKSTIYFYKFIIYIFKISHLEELKKYLKLWLIFLVVDKLINVDHTIKKWKKNIIHFIIFSNN